MPSRLPLFAPSEEAVLSLEVQARLPSTEPEEPVQSRVLVRHFLERFFNNEMASSDGEAKTRLIQVACAVGLPGFVMALYLYPMYHLARGHRPYWAQVSDHYFYVVYSLVALGVVTVFEWDFFFPNLLDVFVLSPLPIENRRLFTARIVAIALFVGGFLFDANFLAPLVLPAATDPPRILRLLTAHVLAVVLSGTFAAAFVLGLQGLLLGILGSRLFRRIALALQGLSITTLLMLLLLSPIVAGVLQGLMFSKSAAVLWFPPFWFLGIYQRLLEGSSTRPIFTTLAQTGCAATALAIVLAVLSYPFAYWRRTRELVEGSGNDHMQRWFLGAMIKAVSAAMAPPRRSAIFQFISQTLLRVPRYRIYLVMYGGLGLALVTACAVRLNLAHGEMRFGLSPGGVRAAVPIVAFWTVAGLRTSFLSPTDQRAAWIFRTIQGRPGLDQLLATKRWVLLWALVLSLGTSVLFHAVGSAGLSDWRVCACRAFVAVGFCLLITDIFFLTVTTIPFTCSRARPTTHLASVVTQYLGIFPLLILFTLRLETWVGASPRNVAITAVIIAATHFALRMIHRRIVGAYTSQIDLDEDQDEFPQTLGLRY